jgi:hypothetical protein
LSALCRGRLRIHVKIVTVQMGQEKAGRTGFPERVCPSAEKSAMPFSEVQD